MLDTAFFNRKQLVHDPYAEKVKAPRSHLWNIMTLNVENLRSLGKHFLLVQIMLKVSIDILCVQETHITSHDRFQYQGFTFFFPVIKTTHMPVLVL